MTAHSLFSEGELYELRLYLTEMEKKFFGLTKPQTRRLIYEYAETRNIDHPFDKGTRMAGDEWLYSFLKHFPVLTLRPTESSQLKNVVTFNQKDVDSFFKTLSNIRRTCNFQPHQIYHADEICISGDPGDCASRFTIGADYKGRGRLLMDKRENVTLMACANAAGAFLPPMIIFPKNKEIPGFLKGFPVGSSGFTNEHDFVNSELFLIFLTHFMQNVRPTISNPILLLVDNYISYISLKALDFCRDNYVFLMGFPPHTQYKLQPLNISFFRSLKECYRQACKGFSGFYTTGLTVGEAFREAHTRAATTANAITGFKESGIEPFNPVLHCTDFFEEKEGSENIGFGFPKLPTGAINASDVKDKPPACINPRKKKLAKDSNDSLEIVEAVDAILPKDDDAIENKKTTRDEAIEVTERPDLKRRVVDNLEETMDPFSNVVANSIERILCLRCEGRFADWIQCDTCKQWWHRYCTAMEKGLLCERCDYFLKGEDSS